MKLVFILMFVLSTEKALSSTKDLDKILGSYQNFTGLKMEVKKIIKSELLDKEDIFEGNLTLSKGKIYWANEKPEKNLLVFDGKTLWTVQYPPAELKGKPQVAKTTLSSKGKTKHILVALLNSKSITEHFKILNETASMPHRSFKIESKYQDLGIKNLEIKINIPNGVISEVSYLDEVDNLTKIYFNNVKKNQKVKANLFDYNPPKDASVSNY